MHGAHVAHFDADATVVLKIAHEVSVMGAGGVAQACLPRLLVTP
jgi:hypothetical protein